MIASTTKFSPKLHRVWKRFIHFETKQEFKPQWMRPSGDETNINIYNPVTKSKVPLISKDKNVLTWYVCGPTVYDSAHIGHATTYVKSDIIRRILSDYFNINVVMAMCITDIDDKIIKRSKETKRSIKDLTLHYENEFFDDMEALNVLKPHLYCRVTNYIPQIIEFINKIIDKGGAYIAKNGCVHFDTNKHILYGKLSKPIMATDHPDKKSALDFTLWKAAKEGEPSWESPWGPGRPGWHIECSTIASTVFGSSIDIHSGGIDLTFPHHENEEAQSCCYHKVDQWVNYWLHCGHLSIEDVKMSKSLKNTILIQEFLKHYSANEFRMLCLLSNYKTGIQFSDTVMANAVSLLKKFEHFIGDCENYITGKWPDCNVDDVTLFRSLNETKSVVETALADDFDTATATRSLITLMNLGIKMLHDYHVTSENRSVAAVAAVAGYVSTMFSKFGISQSKAEENHRMDSIIQHFVNFRSIVRNRILEQKVNDKVLLAACDQVRSDLSNYGVAVKDFKTETTWSRKRY